MTTGSYTVGSTLGPYYRTKTWTGTNGKYSGSKLIWNPYEMHGVSGTQTPGINPLYPGYYLGYAYGPTGAVWTTNDTLALLGQLSAAAKGHQFNMGVAIAESKKSVQLVVNTAIRIARSIRAVKRGRIDLALRELGATPTDAQKRRSRAANQHTKLTDTDVSSMWLEIQYGWKPLLQDVYESQRALEVHLNPPRRSRLRVSKRKRFPDWTNQTYFQKTVIRTTMSRTILFEYEEFLSEPRSLGLTDPLSVAWELTPFSFVADWFIPIGTYLDAINTIPSLNGRILTTVKTESAGTMVGRNLPYVGAISSAKTTDLTRTVESALTIPLPRFNDIETSMSAGRVKNAIALLHQVVRS